MFNNTTDKVNGINYSRYIASWKNAGGTSYREDFIDWLESMKVDQDDIQAIVNLATCGKLELEHSALVFMARAKETRKEKKRFKLF